MNQLFKRTGVCYQPNQIKLIHRLTRKSLFEDLREFAQFRKIVSVRRADNKVREVWEWDHRRWETIVSVVVTYDRSMI